jgi:hypothetical membrane protein
MISIVLCHFLSTILFIFSSLNCVFLSQQFLSYQQLSNILLADSNHITSIIHLMYHQHHSVSALKAPA